ncbi:MAG: phosphatidate cytidylyltransferase [Alphaproteobacteria bacterium]|nr:phosphatidate cytidylyltransferase [Alphaproteobacteria bacterium]
MARQPKFRKSTNLKHRLLSAIILIPISLYIIYLGPPYSLILWAGVTVSLFVEWAFLCLKNQLPFWQKLICVLFGSSYLVFSVLWIFQYLSTGEGWKLIFWLLFLVWSTDTAAYGGGMLFNGPKLAPSISPNKTWAGFFAGMLGGTIVGYEASFWLFPGVFNFWGIVLLVFIAQAGDLLESQVKRWSQLKDSSPLIPGHGGFLDRLDSLLAISFALALWQVWY